MKNISRNAKGEGSFTTNTNGTITHRKSIGCKSNWKVLTVTAATKSACIRKMKKKESEWILKSSLNHVYLQSTIQELCYCHLKSQVDGNELKPKSIDRRECTIEKHIGDYALGQMQVQSVTAADIELHNFNTGR